jgi:hypothetical protein
MKLREVRAFAAYIGRSLVVPLLISVVCAVIAAAIESRVGGRSFWSELDEIGLQVGIAFCLLAYLAELVWRYEQQFRKNLTLGQDLQRTLGSVDAYAYFMAEHLKMAGGMARFLSEVVKDIPQKDGGFVVDGVDDDVYIAYLERALNQADLTFFAILTDPYSGAWFFPCDPAERHRRLRYLELVNDTAKRRGLKARRIMILDETKLESLSPDDRKKFFSCHEYVDLYWIKASDLNSIADFSSYMTYVRRDYALFDKVLLLKRPSSEQLTVAIHPHGSIHAVAYNKLFDDDFLRTHANRFMDKVALEGGFAQTSRAT